MRIQNTRHLKCFRDFYYYSIPRKIKLRYKMNVRLQAIIEKKQSVWYSMMFHLFERLKAFFSTAKQICTRNVTICSIIDNNITICIGKNENIVLCILAHKIFHLHICSLKSEKSHFEAEEIWTNILRIELTVCCRHKVLWILWLLYSVSTSCSAIYYIGYILPYTLSRQTIKNTVVGLQSRKHEF